MNNSSSGRVLVPQQSPTAAPSASTAPIPCSTARRRGPPPRKSARRSKAVAVIQEEAPFQDLDVASVLKQKPQAVWIEGKVVRVLLQADRSAIVGQQIRIDFVR